MTEHTPMPLPPLPGQRSPLSPGLRPPKRTFRMYHRGRAIQTLSADNIRFEGNWVIFSDGPINAVPTNIRAYSSVLEVEEIAKVDNRLDDQPPG